MAHTIKIARPYTLIEEICKFCQHRSVKVKTNKKPPMNDSIQRRNSLRKK